VLGLGISTPAFQVDDAEHALLDNVRLEAREAKQTCVFALLRSRAIACVLLFLLCTLTGSSKYRIQKLRNSSGRSNHLC
jgi:4-hydroxyphenylpyruvate dioxygenase-like putative hemolysin